ncbi:aminopeptidase P family protein [Ureaplasma zalophigenitalium]|uniref:Aminopeptidase P family protein n=1 Tax=Ureaplasma zalophigenitalium TaxID=907723 RepID=A0ABT3BP45_9BACT|nr:aminopeptidase P family protein [Ureaplasma zalophigenitalium]MCV3754020.1 aminopeptidase P family protein [Ureaplasma zalophigenitalium]
MSFKIDQVVNMIKQFKEADGMMLYSTHNRYWFLEFASTDGYVFINKEGRAIFLVDGRYITAAKQEAVNAEVRLLQRTKEKTSADLLQDALNELNIKNLLVEGDYLTLNTHEFIASMVNTTIPFTSAALRAIKTPEEISFLQKACEIAADTCAWIQKQDIIGLTEKQVANMLTKHMLDLGAEKNSFDPIVASGPNGGVPHHHPSDRVIENNDMVTTDIGCYYKGYASDITRSFLVGDKNNPKMQEIYDLVKKSQQAGIDMLSDQVTGAQVDDICRQIIKDAGYDEYFTHGTGHGVGIEVHELPNTNQGNKELLFNYAVVTVEPGIYLPHVGGVRIEDTIAIIDGKPVVLTKNAPK